MNKIISHAMLLLLTACGTASTMIIDDAGGNQTFRKFDRFAIRSAAAGCSVPEETKQDFRDALEIQLLESGKFSAGKGLNIEYKFMGCSEGNQFHRWFMGGIAGVGEGKIVIRADFYDENNKRLGATQTEGRVGAGLFGGSFEDATTAAATDIANYVIRNFGK